GSGVRPQRCSGRVRHTDRSAYPSYSGGVKAAAGPPRALPCPVATIGATPPWCL
ncbi:MAG: hypothetical protein AVDCRST_MAG21-366, partial [uncultured Nocardioidaceae bacterium]